jgi:hypothetical protein
VLEALDRAAEQQRFLHLGHPYRYPVNARLEAFSDGVTWMLLLQQVGFDPRAATVIDAVHVIGPGDRAVTHLLSCIDNPAEVLTWDMRYSGVPILRRGQAFTSPHVGSAIQDVLRGMPPDFQQSLLLDDADRDRIVPGLPPRVLLLDEWHHVDPTVQPRTPERVRAEARHRALVRPGDNAPPFEIRPSDSPTYRQIAQVLATGNASHYRPAQPPTTHWSFWPMGGAL